MNALRQPIRQAIRAVLIGASIAAFVAIPAFGQDTVTTQYTRNADLRSDTPRTEVQNVQWRRGYRRYRRYRLRNNWRRYQNFRRLNRYRYTYPYGYTSRYGYAYPFNYGYTYSPYTYYGGSYRW